MPVRGSTQTMTVTFRAYPGGPVTDVEGLSLTFLRDGATIYGPFTTPQVARDSTGRYRYEWVIPADAIAGTYTAVWSGTVPDADTPSLGYETVAVTAATPPEDPYVEVNPFGASVAGVAELVPEVRLLSAPPTDGQYGITVARVHAWVEEITGVVAMTLTDWQRLSDTPVAPETSSDRAQLIEYARTVIHNGAASYLEAARHPERSTANDTSYAGVLWTRYTDGLNRLAEWLTKRLADGEDGDTPEGPGTGGASYSFPPPFFLDNFRV